MERTNIKNKMITETEQQNILSELSNFIGTQEYHKISMGSLLVTDGINFLANRLNCFWLFDICASVQHLDKIKNNSSFIIWKIKVNDDNSFIVRAYWDYDSKKTLEENKHYLLYEQKAEYTDFPLKEFEFYQCNDILLLKSEY